VSTTKCYETSLNPGAWSSKSYFSKPGRRGISSRTRPSSFSLMQPAINKDMAQRAGSVLNGLMLWANTSSCVCVSRTIGVCVDLWMRLSLKLRISDSLRLKMFSHATKHAMRSLMKTDASLDAESRDQVRWSRDLSKHEKLLLKTGARADLVGHSALRYPYDGMNDLRWARWKLLCKRLPRGRFGMATIRSRVKPGLDVELDSAVHNQGCWHK
jgi:hypothetical protein